MGATACFVRRPNENQAWLVRAVFTPRGDPGAWLNTHVLNMGPARLQEVDP